MEFKSLSKFEKSVLAKFATIGRTNDGSFVLIGKDRIKTVQANSMIQATYKFDEIKFDIEKSFTIFDSSILASLLDICDKYKLKLIKNSFTLGLFDENERSLGTAKGDICDHAEITDKKDLDNYYNNLGQLTVNRIIQSDDGMQAKFKKVKDTAIISGVLTSENFNSIQTYMKKIKGDYFTFSPSEIENEVNVTIQRSSSTISHTFSIKMDKVNFPEGKHEVMFRFPLDYIIGCEDGYNIEVCETGMHLKGIDVNVEYLIAVITVTYQDELKEVLRQSENQIKDEINEMINLG